MELRHVFSHAPWEAQIAYCRALRVGANICVTGTARADEAGTGVHGIGDA